VEWLFFKEKPLHLCDFEDIASEKPVYPSWADNFNDALPRLEDTSPDLCLEVL